MTTALVNLLDNAWKYTEADKQIVLRAYGDDGRVSFAVSDNGIGLSRAACKKVFERFYQVDRELSRSRGGCGLGLSIVEFIVKGHGGRRDRPQPARPRKHVHHRSASRGNRLTVCHCFAEAVPGATRHPGTACSKQWHTVLRNAD